MKQCNFCMVYFPLSAFGSKSAKCRMCKSSIDQGRERNCKPNPLRNTTASARARKRRWNANNKNKEKNAARRAVRNAILKGLLTPPNNCEKCKKYQFRIDGVRAIQAHHEDYSKPLNVQWLCPPCHVAAHNAARKEGK